MEYKIEGLEEAIRELRDPEVIGGPLRNFFARAAITVQNAARGGAPVDTGRLRAGIGFEIDQSEIPEWATVGTNVFYAAAQEFGTGTQTDGTMGGGGPHWPPAAMLDTWAARHGFESGFQVARIIGRRGGLLPKRFLRDGMRNSLTAIEGFVKRLGEEIEARWGR